MRNKYKLTLFSLVLIVMGFVGCNKLEVQDPITPENLVIATIEPDFTGSTVTEGDTIGYKITLDHYILDDVTFEVTFDASGTSNENDFELLSDGVVSIPKYSTEGWIHMVINVDNFAEVTENLKFTISEPTVLYRYLFAPNTSVLDVDLTVTNVNDPSFLSVGFEWYTEEDIDIVTFRNTGTKIKTYGSTGSTASNPEVCADFTLLSPDFTYYVNIIHYGVAPFDYKFAIGKPDGTIEWISGTFDSNNLGQYTMDLWDGFGADADILPSYRVLQVVKVGDTFTVTKL